MCGIAGILRLTPPGDGAHAALERTPFDAIPEQWLNLLDDSIRHRGPDGQGRFRDRAVRADGTVTDIALVHRRLSIIDHGGGAQPMISQQGPCASLGQPSALAFHSLVFHGSPDASVHYQQLPDTADTLAVVFNGCIYNHRELRRELEQSGNAFATDHSDTEVLLHGWREWNSDLLERLEGMYAAAIWNRADGEFALFRDGFGEKPLYRLEARSKDEQVIVFSSCAPGIERLVAAASNEKPFGSLCVDVPTIAGWTKYGWNQGIGVAKVTQTLPGFCNLSRGGTAADAAAHTPTVKGPAAQVFGERNGEPTEEAVESALAAAVHCRLEADVPLGVFLSGGIDSALVARFAAQKRPDIEAFTVRMPAKDYDESAAASETAAALGIRHRVLECHPRPAEDLIATIHQLGLPFGDSSLLPSIWVSRAAREHVKVALAGDGGDELFLGYERQSVLPLLTRLSQWGPALWREIGGYVGEGAPSKSILSKIRRLLLAAGHGGYKDLLAIFPPPLDRELGLTGFLDDRPTAHYGMYFPEMSGADQIVQALRLDLCFYLPEDLLRKTDTASMSVALEVRAPFLDSRLGALAMKAKVSSLMPRGERKGLLRAVARRHLPAHIVDQPKMGFAIPIGEWFRSDYGGLRTLLLDHMHSAEPFGPPSLGIDLNMAYVRQMLDEHLGTGKSGLVKRDHSQRLYMLLVLSIWAKWLGSLGRNEAPPL